MNLKSYLSGLGLGIIVTALILSIAGGGNKEMTDSQIKERAQELGMTDTSVVLTNETDTQKTSGTQVSSVTAADSDQKSSAKNTSEKTESSVKKDGSAQAKAEAKADSSTQAKTEAKADSGAQSEAKQSVITIVSGDSSYSVAQKLEKAGLVSSAAEYDRFLCSNGYDKKIRTGSFTVTLGESEEQIAESITGK